LKLNLALESAKEIAKKLAKGSDSFVEFGEFWQKISLLNSLQWKITKNTFYWTQFDERINRWTPTLPVGFWPVLFESLEWKKQHRWVWWITTKSKFDKLTSIENY
jgi:hypothetical protein